MSIRLISVFFRDDCMQCMPTSNLSKHFRGQCVLELSSEHVFLWPGTDYVPQLQYRTIPERCWGKLLHELQCWKVPECFTGVSVLQLQCRAISVGNRCYTLLQL